MEKGTWYNTENKKPDDGPEDGIEDWKLPEGWREERTKGENTKDMGGRGREKD